MIVLVVALSGLLVSLLTGGKVVELADLRLRAPALAVGTFAVQAAVLELPPTAPAEELHVATYAAMAVWLWLNRRTGGVAAIAIGAGLNAAPIIANGGVMPASPAAATIAGLPTGEGFANSAVNADAVLWWLGDVFAIPANWPLANVFSAGDVVLALGVATMLWRVSRPRPDFDPPAPPVGTGMQRAAAAVTGLPVRWHTVGIVAITATAASGCVVAHILSAGRTNSVSLGTAAALLLLVAVAEAVPIANDGENHTPTNLLMVIVAMTAPSIAVPGIAAAILLGQATHRIRFRRSAGQHSPPRLAAYKALNAAACDTLVAVAVGAVAAGLVGGDPTDPMVWLAAATAAVVYDILLHPVVATLIALAAGRLPALVAMQPANPVATLVTASPAPLLCLAAAHGPAWTLLPLAIPLAAWSFTADRYVRHTDWLSADHVTGLPVRQKFLGDITPPRTGPSEIHAIQIVDLIGIEQAAGTNTASRVMADAAAILAVHVKGHPLGHVARDTLAVAAPAGQIDPHELINRLSGTYDVDGVQVPVEITVGTSGPAREDAGVLLLRAEAAIEQGHGSVRTHTTRMAMSTRDELELAADLRTAFTDGQIVPWYQPIMSAGDPPTMIAAEALARWDHPDRGVLAPGAWLAKATRLGLDHQLTGIIVDAVCADIATWTRSHDAAVHVHINATAYDLAGGVLPGQVAGACARHGVDPSWLTIEFTEESAMVDQDATTRTVKSLHDLGCRVAIDDFGVGHSSLGRLAMFDIDELKIDRSMIRDAHSHPRVVTVLSALVELGHSLDMRVVAEGVENARDIRMMTSLGVDKLQGFGLGRPSDADTFITEADAHGETMPATAPDSTADLDHPDRAPHHR